MSATNTIAIGGLILLAAVTVLIVVFASLILLASRWIVGRGGMFGSAAMAVIASFVASAGVGYGVMRLTAEVPAVLSFAIPLQILLNVALTVVIYRLMLDPKPTFVQALLIFLIQSVIGAVLVFGGLFLATAVFHLTLPPVPDLPAMP